MVVSIIYHPIQPLTSREWRIVLTALENLRIHEAIVSGEPVTLDEFSNLLGKIPYAALHDHLNGRE